MEKETKDTWKITMKEALEKGCLINFD